MSNSTSLSGAIGLAVSGHYAYTTAYWPGELTVLDVSNPKSPVVVASTPASASIVGASQVNIVGTDAFVVAKNENASTSSNDNGTGDSLTVVDISNPLAPSVVGVPVRDTTNLFGAYGVAVSGHYAFVAAQGVLGGGQPQVPDTSKGSFSVIDLNNLSGGVVTSISNPASGPFANALNHATAVSIQGNYAYVTAFNSSRLTVIDISNPTSPVIKASLSDSANLSAPNDVVVSGSYAYVDNQSNWNANTNVPQLTVVDISNPLAPKVVGVGVSSPLLNNAYRVRLQGDFAYLTGKNAASLGAVDISNPRVPRLTATVTDTTHLNSLIGVDVESTPSGAYAIVSSPFLSSQGNHTYPPYPAPGNGTSAGGTGTVSAIQLDPTPISVAIVPGSEPTNPTTSTSASFTFGPSDQVYSVQCSLDSAAFGPCSSAISMSYSSLSPGPHTFTVQVTDASGNTAQDSYSWTISGTAPQNTGAPQISGSATVGGQLTVSNGTWSGSPAPSFAYQWERCDVNGNNCVNATGTGATTSAYTAAPGDAGSTLIAVVTASNGVPPAASAPSSPTARVTAAPQYTGTAPQLSGSATVGGQLTVVSNGSWSGYPAPSFTYQWEQCNQSGGGCVNAQGAGATTSTYTVAPGDAGSTLVAVVTASNGIAPAAQASSSPSGVVPTAPAAPQNTGLPQLSGSATVGGQLMVSNGSWTGSPAPTFTYQWEQCNQSGGGCVNAQGTGATTSTYTVAPGDAGSTLVAVVTASNGVPPAAQASSSPSGVVPTPPAAPHNTGAPQISGTPAQGSQLTAAPGTWTGTPAPTFTYQWERCSSGSCSAISGATGSTYTTQRPDVGSTVNVLVKASNTAGSSTATATATAVVTGPPVATTLPTISGTPAVGSTLTGTNATWTGYPASAYKYRWWRCNKTGASCVAISGPTGTSYTVSSADLGSTLRFVVGANNGVANTVAESNPTLVVSAGSVVHLSLRRALLDRPRKGSPTLRLTLKAATSGAQIRQVLITLPKGLRLARAATLARHGLHLTGARGKKLGFTARLRGQALVLTFTHAQPAATVLIGSPALTVLGPQFTARQTKKPKNVTVSLIAAPSGAVTHARLSLRVRGSG